MLLQDALASTPPFAIETSDGRVHQMRSAANVACDVAAAPVRYVLDDAAAALVTHTAFGAENTLGQSLDLLRFPSTIFWMEWHDAGRVATLQKAGLMDEASLPEKTGRAGAIVRADDAGRRGTISILWQEENSEATLSPVTIEFDLDDAAFSVTPDPKALTYDAKIVEGVDLSELLACVRFRFDPSWRDYYSAYSKTKAAAKAVFDQAVSITVGDFPFIAAFCLVLSARGALRYDPSALKRLNAARKRRGGAALLEHVAVSLDLGERDSPPGAGASFRNSPRLHHVCGHLVRRGDSLHWRRPHLRGNPRSGTIASRTVRVGRSVSSD